MPMQSTNDAPRAARDSPPPYVGRFAPSPTGALHAGSLVAALASRLDARAHGGRWLVRIEDVDAPREVPGAAQRIVEQLDRLGMTPDGDVEHQSRRTALYGAAFERLRAAGLVYPCACTRREIADSLTRLGGARRRHAELVYPGTCRGGIAEGRVPRAWRVRVDDARIDWCDRRAGARTESLATEVGDFVLLRADGVWAYQLAVVVDDGAQGITDVVRGADLAQSTARQVYLQRLLGLPTPRYLHVPVVTDARGEKLSKQTGAAEPDLDDPIGELNRALRHLRLPDVRATTLAGFHAAATELWRASPWMGDACARPAG